MSTCITAALITFSICAVISLIIAIPLQTAGYDEHVIKNEALVATECEVVEWLISSATCYRSCNCYNICTQQCTTTTVNGHPSTRCSPQCTQHCQSCPYTCYTASWRVEYSPLDMFGNPVVMGKDITSDNSTDLPQTVRYSVNLSGPRSNYDTQASAQNGLGQRPIGSKFVCYYDSTNLGDVRLEKYDLLGFFASYITFYVLAGICGVAIVILLIICACDRYN